MEIKTALTAPTPLLRSVPAKLSTVTDEAIVADEAVAATEDSSAISNDAGQRIGHFVRSVTHESLQHVQYLAGANAFSKVGSTIGSLAITPLAIKLAADNAAVVGGLAIGGTVAAGALGGLLGYLWLRNSDEDASSEEQKSSVFGKVVDASLDVASGLRALPKFIYPSIYGATDAQRDAIYGALDSLPLEDATASASMTVVPNLVDTGISGMSQPGASHVRILLDASYLDSPSRAADLVLHENGHAVDYSGGFGLLGSNNWKAGFGKGPFISEYAAGNRYEDWADTYEAYHKNPADVTARFPEKAEAIARSAEQNALYRAADQPKIREAGKSIGETLAKLPYLRDGLELAGSLVGPVQIYRGTGDLIKGLETDNGELQLKGKFNFASGLFLSLPGAGPLALVSSIAGAALKTTSAGGTPEELQSANKLANGVLSVSAGPVGMTIGAIAGELSANGLHYDDSHGFTGQGWQSARASKSSMLKGTIATVGGAVAGSLTGAALGAVLGGRTGAAIGGVWGQLAGGALGLGVYGASRALRSDRKDKDPLALTGGDKRFLGGLVGGALAGGTVGTGLGVYGGKTLGGLLGGALAGPAGAQVGSTIGGWSGALLGAYGGSKLGAGIGSGRLLGQEHQYQTLARPNLAKAD